MVANFRTLFSLCCLGFIIFPRAQSFNIEHLTAQMVEKALLSTRAFKYPESTDLSRRLKREVTTTKLDDPKDCISICRTNHTNELEEIQGNFAGVAAADTVEYIHSHKLNYTDSLTPKQEQEIQDVVTNALGKVWVDICSLVNRSSKCYSNCPDSKLRTIMLLDTHRESYCEARNAWSNFTEFWYAQNCTNATESEQQCAKQCGSQDSPKNATSLDIKEKEGDEGLRQIFLVYENDTKKNTAAIGPVCKTILCELDCHKPIMTKRCGAKAYENYATITKTRTRNSLSTLKLLNALNGTVTECKDLE